MDTYSILRQFADSWVLLAMFLFFIGVIIFAFWPGRSSANQDASMIPFRNEDAPDTDCDGKCDTCACDSLNLKIEEVPNG